MGNFVSLTSKECMFPTKDTRGLMSALQCVSAYSIMGHKIYHDIYHSKLIDIVVSQYGSDKLVTIPYTNGILKSIYKNICKTAQKDDYILWPYYLAESDLIVIDVFYRLDNAIYITAMSICIDNTTAKELDDVEYITISSIELFYRRFPITRYRPTHQYKLIYRDIHVELGSDQRVEIVVHPSDHIGLSQRGWYDKHLHYDPLFDIISDKTVDLNISIIGAGYMFYTLLDKIYKKHADEPIERWDPDKKQINTTLWSYETLYIRIEKEIRYLSSLCDPSRSYDSPQDGCWSVVNIYIEDTVTVVVAIQHLLLRSPLFALRK